MGSSLPVPARIVNTSLSQVILAKYASDTILQAGWALASLDLLGSPGLMIRSTLTGVRDLVYLPYEGQYCIYIILCVTWCEYCALIG